jgi:methyl-accepting chemotaxis protein
LRVNFAELQERIGKGLIPVVGGLVDALNDSFDAFNKAADGAGDLAGQIPLLNQAADSDRVRSFVREWGKFAITSIALGPAIAGVTTAMDIFGDETEETTGQLTIFDKIAGQIAGSLGRVANAFDKVVAGLPTQQQRSDLSLTLAQASGDQGAELAELRAREQRQAAFLERLLDEPALTSKQIELQRKAAAQLDQTRDQINAILDQQASDAEKAATDARAAQSRTQQAFLEMLGSQPQSSGGWNRVPEGRHPLQQGVPRASAQADRAGAGDGHRCAAQSTRVALTHRSSHPGWGRDQGPAAAAARGSA